MNIITNLKNIYVGAYLATTAIGIVGGIIVTRKIKKGIADFVESVIDDAEKGQDESNIIDLAKVQIVDFQ